MKKAEQIDKYERPGVRRFLKRQVKRARRRAERSNPEYAPGRVRDYIQGYSS